MIARRIFSKCLRRPFSTRLRLEQFESRIQPSVYLVHTFMDNGSNMAPTPGSLREAINYVNFGLHDEIQFDMFFTPGATTISPPAPLPPLAKTVTIGGGTMPGMLPMEIDGSAQMAGSGLTFAAGGSLKGVAIYGFPEFGVNVVGGVVSIDSCLIGTNLAGTMPIPNKGGGIALATAGNSVKGSLISSNGKDGIMIVGPGGNLITGNTIGLNLAGTLPFANSAAGIKIDDSPDNIIGGAGSLANIIAGNSTHGILVNGTMSKNTIIRGNKIGNSVASNMGDGIRVIDAPSTIIGGTASGEGNVIANNKGNGIALVFAGGLTPTDPGALIQGNYIGTNDAGTADLGNSAAGIVIMGLANNFIGGDTAGAGNLISGNDITGINILGGDKNTVSGNLIGTDAAGTAKIPNKIGGIGVSSADNLIGGITPLSRNVISGNSGEGIALLSAGAKSNKVYGNLIGVDIDGSVALPNTLVGVLITSGAKFNSIGGGDADDGVVDTKVKARNIISGNDKSGVVISDETTTGNFVLGNYIGLSITGLAATPNAEDGVRIESSPGNSIGSILELATNFISGNTKTGITVTGEKAVGNVIYQNAIGIKTDMDKTALGNKSYGIFVGDKASMTKIGAEFGSNTIAFNGESVGTKGLKGHGIVIDSGTKNTISRNSIHRNFGRGIDLRKTATMEDGPTLNDTYGSSISKDGDPDTGANDLQDYPVVVGRAAGGLYTGVQTWKLSTKAGTTYNIEFFANSELDPSGWGEGESLIGLAMVTTDVYGEATVGFNSFGFPNISATATDSDGNTSEFSLIDSDADGLADAWETPVGPIFKGMDINEDGATDLDLYSKGARLDHRDLFVEVDVMQGIYDFNKIKAAVVDVVNAFADVPNTLIHNPDGLKGIALHASLDDPTTDVDIPLNQAWQGIDAKHWTEFQKVKDGTSDGTGKGLNGKFGSDGDRISPNWDNIRSARRLTFRYAMFAYDHDGGSSGVAELERVGGDTKHNGAGPSVGGNDFMVTLGNWDNLNALTQRDFAGTFMHELGHTLNLRHGGGDDDNRKPNYHSVMSYNWQIPTNMLNRFDDDRDDLYTPSLRLDYSQQKFNSLDESNLNENTGVSAPGGFLAIYAGKSAPFGVSFDLGAKNTHNVIATHGGNTNWNQFGPDTDIGTLADINFDGSNGTPEHPYQVLPGHEDWSGIQYYFGESRFTTPGQNPAEGEDLEEEHEVVVPPPRISQVVINNGDAQRSRVTSVAVHFDQHIDITFSLLDAFVITRQSDGKTPSINGIVDDSGSGTIVTLSFFGSTAVDNTSLADGRYTLQIEADDITNAYGKLDGDGNGIGGDDYTLASAVSPNPPTNIFRIFGDITGDGSVAASDFIVFRQFFNGVNAAFDFDNDGSVSSSDFIQFRQRFNGSI